jgi:hypothetical protein
MTDGERGVRYTVPRFLQLLREKEVLHGGAVFAEGVPCRRPPLQGLDVARLDCEGAAAVALSARRI